MILSYIITSNLFMNHIAFFRFIKLSLIALLAIHSTAKGQNPYINAKQDITAINNHLAGYCKPFERFDLLNRKAGHFIAIGNLDSLNPVSQEMLILAQQLENDSSLIVTYNIIGDYFLLKGSWADGLEYLFKGIQLAEQTSNNGFLCSMYLDASHIYSRGLENNVNALKYGRKAQALLGDKRLSHTNLPVQVYAAVARIFVRTNELDSALYYAQRANEALFGLKDDYQYLNVLVTFARTYDLMKDEALAETYYKKVIFIADSLNFQTYQQLGNYFYANFLYQRNNYPAAKKYCLQSLKAAMQMHNYSFVVNSTELCKNIYNKIQNKDSNYYYTLLKDAYIDSLNTENKISKLQDIALNQRLHEIEEEGRQRQEAQQRRESLQYALIALGLISFFILFLLLSRSIITSARLIAFLGILALLMVFEFLNLLLHPYLQKITRHQPILMLVTMVIIAALLIPIHHRLEHWVTHKMVEKNKKIRLAAAKKTIAALEKDEAGQESNE